MSAGAKNLPLSFHGSQDSWRYGPATHAIDFPQDLTDIKSVYNSETLHVENLIFVSESQGDIAVIQEQYNAADSEGHYIASVKIRAGLRLVGLQSIDIEDDKLGRVIAKLKFIFIDLTQVRCQEPSDLLVKDIVAVFLEYDTNNDALISSSEFDLIRTKLGIQPFPDVVVIPATLDLEEFKEYAVAYLINSQGELDIGKLIENDSNTSPSNNGSSGDSTGADTSTSTDENGEQA